MLVLMERLFDKSKAGHAVAVRRMILWLLALTTAFVVLCCLYVPRAKTYTELHRVTAETVRRIIVLEGYHD